MAPRFSFSLYTIFKITSVAAIALTTLRYAGTWQPLLMSLTSSVVMYAVVSAVCRQRTERFFWLAFAICSAGQAFTTMLGETTIVWKLLVNLHPYFAELRPDPNNPSQTILQPRDHEFIVVGHAWFILLAGYLGGCVGRRMYLNRGRVVELPEAGEPSE